MLLSFYKKCGLRLIKINKLKLIIMIHVIIIIIIIIILQYSIQVLCFVDIVVIMWKKKYLYCITILRQSCRLLLDTRCLVFYKFVFVQLLMVGGFELRTYSCLPIVKSYLHIKAVFLTPDREILCRCRVLMWSQLIDVALTLLMSHNRLSLFCYRLMIPMFTMWRHHAKPMTRTLCVSSTHC